MLRARFARLCVVVCVSKARVLSLVQHTKAFLPKPFSFFFFFFLFFFFEKKKKKKKFQILCEIGRLDMIPQIYR